jgi:hypothetical protein
LTNAELLEEAAEMYAAYKAAELAVLKSQAYSIGNRSYTFADLEEIRKGKKQALSDLQTLSRGNKIRCQGVVPRDI